MSSRSRDKFPIWQWSILIALLFAICLSALPLGSNRPLAWILLVLCLLLIGGVQLLIDLWQPFPAQIKRLWLPSVLFLIPLGWAGLQILPGVSDLLAHPSWSRVEAPARIGADPEQAQHMLVRLLAYALTFWVALRCALSSTRADIMLRSFALFSTALAIFGLFALATGQNIFLELDGQTPSLSASFVNRNHYATYAIFGALANIAAYLHLYERQTVNEDRWESRLRDLIERFFSGAWIFALGALICIASVALTQSRAGSIAGLIGLSVFVILWRGASQRGTIVMTGILGGLLLFVTVTSTSGLMARFVALGEETARLVAYPRMFSVIAERPLLGHGLGSFQEVFRAHIPPEIAYAEWSQAHNSYLENIIEFGVPAALAFYSALGLIAWQLWRGTRQKRQNRAFTCFALAAFAAAAFHALFDFSLQIPAISVAFAMILGLGWAQSQPQVKKRRRTTRILTEEEQEIPISISVTRDA